MKFTLEERFVLQEADEKTGIDSATEKIKAEVEEESEKNKTSNEINWDARYNACKTEEDFQIFWYGSGDNTEEDTIKRYGYFLSAWGKENGKYVSGLGAKFMEYLTDLGFTAETNVFVRFIEKLIKKPISTARLSQLNLLNFPPVIKAHDENYLTDDDLLDGGQLGPYNLIFNANFYKAITSDQESYLKAQADFVRKTKITGNLGVAFANFYDTKGNPMDPTKSIVPGGSLVAANKLRNRINKNIGIQEADDKAIESILTAVKTAEEAKLIIAYAYDAFSLLMPEAIDAAEKQTGGAIGSIRQAIALSKVNAVKGKALFKLPSMNYQASQVTKILVSLAIKAGKYTPKEDV